MDIKFKHSKKIILFLILISVLISVTAAMANAAYHGGR
jgi:hypothetical protein